MGFNSIKVNNTDTNYTHSIFDISEYNSGAIYANLSAALAAVPQNKKQGGMSVKFILTITQAQYSVVKTENLLTEPTTGTLLSEAPNIESGTYDESQLSTIFNTLPSSTGAGNALTYYVAVTVDETTTYTSWVITKVQNSDNQYVQYRLMSDSFNTTVANWLGVDDLPTVGSDNLVKSKGVANELNIYEEKAKADYDKTTAYSPYQAFSLTAGKKYRITLTCTNFTAPDSSTLSVRLFAHQTGTSQSDSLTALFGGASEIIKGNPISIEYTPAFNYNYIKTDCLSSYVPAEGCHVLAVAEEIIDKFDVLDAKVTTEKTRAEEVEQNLQQSINTEVQRAQSVENNLQQAISNINSEIIDYDEVARADYNQPNWNSGYYNFILEANKKYRLTLTCTNFVRPNSGLLHAYLYAAGSGTAQHEDITSLFGGAAELIKGNPISIEYTPIFKVNFIATRVEISSYVPAEGCHVLAIAEEIIDKFEELDTKITKETQRAQNAEQTLESSVDALKASLLEYTEKARLEYSQTGWNSGYKAFTLQVNKKYRLKLQVIGFDNEYRGDLGLELYASQSGSAQHVNIISIFGGSTVVTAGELLTVEYTPTFTSYYMRTAYRVSTEGPKETNSVLFVADEITERYALNENVGNLSDLETENKESIVAAINSVLSIQNPVLPINIFGDILPTSFKNKLFGDDDLLIACQGDSITGHVSPCTQVENPAHVSPFGRYMHFVAMLQYNVCKIKPYYNRLDSQRDDVDVFTKTGTWTQVSENDFGPNGSPAVADKYKDSSETARTFRSADSNAAISFVFDADTYDKCNIFFTKNIQAGNAEIVITEGNGKMLVSEDRINWVEANRYTHSQALIADYTSNGNPYVERQRRLWMKKVSDVTGEIHITYQRADTDTNYIYCWGTEMYSGRAILFDNIGRGGRTITLLADNIGDIFDRNPDLTIFEMPLANDLYHHTSVSDLLAEYAKYFTSDAAYSYKNRSNNYSGCPVVIVLTHIRSTAFNGDGATFEGSTQTILTDPAYDIYKKVWNWLHTQLSQYNNVAFANLLDQYLNEAKAMYGSYQAGLSSGNLTADSTHLNQKGSDLYVKYLAPIFLI